MSPEISVIITAYNRAPLLARAVESLIAGGEGVNWEAVVVDDGSGDGTLEEALRLMRRLSPRTLRYLWQPNRGLVAARNSGIAAARAQVVTFLDSDDEYAPRHLASRMAIVSGSEEPDMVHGGIQIVGGADWVPDKFDPTRRIPIADCFVGGTFVFRRDLWQRLGGFRLPNYGDDHDFMVRAMESGARITRCDLPTYIYHRDTPDGLCNVLGADSG